MLGLDRPGPALHRRPCIEHGQFELGPPGDAVEHDGSKRRRLREDHRQANGPGRRSSTGLAFARRRSFLCDGGAARQGGWEALPAAQGRARAPRAVAPSGAPHATLRGRAFGRRYGWRRRWGSAARTRRRARRTPSPRREACLPGRRDRRPEATPTRRGSARASARARRSASTPPAADIHAAARPAGPTPALDACDRAPGSPARCLRRRPRGDGPRGRSPRSRRSSCRSEGRAGRRSPCRAAPSSGRTVTRRATRSERRSGRPASGGSPQERRRPRGRSSRSRRRLRVGRW